MTRGGCISGAAVGLILAASLGPRARAQVLTIDPDGAVVVLAGPAVFSDPAGSPTPIPSPPKHPSDPQIRRVGGGQTLSSAAADNGLSPKVVEAVAWRESRFDSRAVSPKGALGVMQLMPATARAMGVDPRDPAANLQGGAAYLARMMRTFDGDVILALAAYNAGPAAVKRHAGVPPYPETRAFVDAILRRLADDVSPDRAQGLAPAFRQDLGGAR